MDGKDTVATGANTAAVLTDIGTIVLEERDRPVLADDQVLIRVEAVGVCGSDAHYYHHGRIGSFVVQAPLVLGHETAGVVAAVGEQVRSHAVGDRVAVEPGVPCGTCALCRSGHYNLCREVIFHGTPPVDGTLQRFIAVRQDYVFALPDAVSTEEGALVEPLAVAVWACRKAGIEPGMRVLITGAGTVGLLMAQTALAFGASWVTITDLDPGKLEMALRLGASEAIDARNAAEGLSGEYDAYLECSGSPAATRDGIARLAPLGIAVLVGMGPSEGLGIPVSLIQERELRITGTFRYANCFPAAIELLASGRVSVAELITNRFPLARTAEAIEASGQLGVFKNVISPSSAG